jgi:outer membrane protein, heavy metal efflux system
MNKPIALMRTSTVLLAGLLLTACASTPPENSVALVQQQLNQAYPGTDLSAPPRELNDETLSLHTAMQTLLSRSPQVRVELAQLGIADAQRLQAELSNNPHLSIGA